MRQRIQTLDGLRFLAAIGVLWVHTWTFFGNPRYYIGPVDIADLMAIGGNGVDLFFVISGFCMYYFYASKSNFSYADFFRFLFKRWVRLSPAFYFATLTYILVGIFVYQLHINVLFNFLHSLFYLNYFFGQYGTAAHFWTLTVEWQFYFIIPFILIYQNKIGFKKTFGIIFSIVLAVAVACILLLKNGADILSATLVFHGLEFACGILAARLLLKNPVYFRNRMVWLITFIIITYAGRVFISKHFLGLSIAYGNFFRLAGFTLLGLGFAGILYLSVTSIKWLNLILGNSLFKTMGRISYSFYLWHVLFYPVIAGYIASLMPLQKGIGISVLATTAAAVVLYPVSLLSYNLLEKPFLSVGNLSSK